MALAALPKELAPPVGAHHENFPGIAGSYEQSVLPIDRQRPDIFCFRLEECAFGAVGRDLIDLAIRGGPYVKIVRGIEGNRLGREFVGLEDSGGLSSFIKSKDFRVRSTGRVETRFRIQTQRPNVGQIRRSE